MDIIFSGLEAAKKGAVIVFAHEAKLSESAEKLDKDLAGLLEKTIKSSRFTGKKGNLLLVTPPASSPLSRVLLVGLGKADKLTALTYEEVGGRVFAKLDAAGESLATAYIDAAGDKVGVGEASARFAEGAYLRSYRFDRYRTKMKEDKKPRLTKLVIASAAQDKAREHFARREVVVEGVFFTRDLISEPGNVIYPESFVEEAKKLAKLGVEIEVLGEEEMAKLGMNSLLAVGQGSRRESKLLILRWNGAREEKDKAPLAFVGKGVCFDTGGISLKPTFGTWGMWEMKFDMGGAGVVVGLMQTLAKRKAKVNVVGLCGLVENMPDGNAQRPGDVVTSMSGQTIEVLNTDAEGRLVLADVLTYAQENYKPQLIVDLATLTGAIITALGNNIAGLFSNNDKLAEQLDAAGKDMGEPLWRLPLSDDFDRAIDSDIADMKNIAGAVVGAGSSIGAQFLKRFVDDKMPWAHIDIAGTTWTKSDKPISPKGATGFGVRLLDNFVAKNFEK